MLWIWGSDEGKVYFLFGSPAVGRVCSGMWSPCMDRTSFKIWGSDVTLSTVVTGGEESDRPAPEFGGLDGDRFCFEIWDPSVDRVWSRISGSDVDMVD